MSKTIKAIMAHMVPVVKQAPVRSSIGTVVAEWQDGPGTFSDRAQRKLRLVFAPLPLNRPQDNLTTAEVSTNKQYK